MDEITQILREAQRIEVRARGMVSNEFSGEYRSSFKGRGIDFHDLREYTHGDDVRSIDWNTTARTAEPYVKQFIERRELNIYIAIDISSSSNYGSIKFSKRKIAAIISAIFTLSAAKNGDKVGLILFSDTVEHFSAAKKGTANCMRILRETLLYPHKNRQSNPGCALEFLLNHQSRKSLILLASDFLCDDFEKPLKISSSKNDIIAIQLIDPAERELPRVGNVRLTDPETGITQTVKTGSESVQQNYSQNRSLWQNNLERIFESNGVDKITLSTDNEPNVALSLRKFFNKRKT
ncbi:MAG: DUF58 domain-containing protein [Verrucomicrobiota bacterium]|nr:DUF58 domain-containing protein [Verrucomicrobiota bacterium]